jgi:hypothetical protein
MDLREYSEQVRANLLETQDLAVQDLLESQTELAELFSQIDTSNSILMRLEKLLTEFQADLGGISTEIKNLQEQSLSMSISLNNRKELEKRLDNYLKQVILTQEIVNTICNAEIDESFLQAINELREKLRYFKTEGRLMINDTAITALSMQEVYPEFQKVNHKAASRIRAFMISHLQKLKSKPRTNLQVLQDNVLLKYKDLLQFLRENNQETFVEICMHFTDTLGYIYHKNFKDYFTQLKKFSMDRSSKHDMIISENMLTPGAWKLEAFELSDRVLILENLDKTDYILPHVAKKNNEKYFLERIYQNIVSMLVETCFDNFKFVLDFFGIRPEQYPPVFGEIFKPTYQMLIDNFSYLFSGTYDILALLIILRINSHYQQVLYESNVPIMTDFFEKVRMTIWPRLQYLIDTNIRELENGKNLKTYDLTVTPVTARFTQLTTNIHKIAPSDDMFRQRLSQLRKQMLNLLIEMASELKDDKNRVVFIINNLDYILDEFHQQAVPISDEFATFETDLNFYVDKFLDLQLRELFGNMMDFLDISGNVTPNDADMLIRDFNAKWRRSIQILETLEKELFTNELTQKEILRKSQTEFLKKYQNFTDVIREKFPIFAKQLITRQNIMAEIQR